MDIIQKYSFNQLKLQFRSKDEKKELDGVLIFVSHCIVYDARKGNGRAAVGVSPTAEGDPGAGRLIHSYIPARSLARRPGSVCGLLFSWVGEGDSRRREVVGLRGPSTHT